MIRNENENGSVNVNCSMVIYYKKKQKMMSLQYMQFFL